MAECRSRNIVDLVLTLIIAEAQLALCADPVFDIPGSVQVASAASTWLRVCVWPGEGIALSSNASHLLHVRLSSPAASSVAGVTSFQSLQSWPSAAVSLATYESPHLEHV